MATTRRLHAVIVDDDAQLRQLIAYVLEAAGITVVGEAEDGKSGVEAVAEHAPDLVITDLHMPDTDGWWLTRELRARHPALPIIMVTSDHVPALSDQADAYGVTALVSKAAGVEAIVAAAREHAPRQT